MSQKTDFINQMYQAGLKAGLSDAAARVMAAQSGIESAYGARAPGNNFFAITKGADWTGPTVTRTDKDANGNPVKQQFRVYASPEAGIADRVAVMNAKFPGFNNAATMGDALAALQHGTLGKYYQAPQAQYEAAVKGINSKYLPLGHPIPPLDVPNAAPPGSTAASYLAGKQYGAPGGGVGVNADKMAPEFANRLQALIQAAEQATGDKVSIFEGYRDPKRSAQLHADYIGSPVTYKGMTYQPTPGMKGKYKAAGPDVSEHNRGMAADIRAGKNPDKYPSGPAYDYMVKHAKEFGLVNLGASDPAHFQIPANEYKMAAAGKPLQPFTNNNPAGLVPPMNIPQVGTALDVIDKAVPRSGSTVASAYAAPPVPRNRPIAAPPPPMPQPRPSNIDNGGFNMAPPALPLNAPLPVGRGSSYGPNTPNWGPSVANLGMPPMPGNLTASGKALPAVTAKGAATLAAPAPGVAFGGGWGSGAFAPVPMPGRPAALSAAPPAPVQAQPPQLPAQRPSAPVAPPPVQLRLASGKTIAPGIYDQGGHSVQVSDAGDGTAKITQIHGPMSIPGLIDPLREANAPTVAGGMIRRMAPVAASSAVSSFAPAAVDSAKGTALGAASGLGGMVSNIPGATQAGDAIGNVLGIFGSIANVKAPPPISSWWGQAFPPQPTRYAPSAIRTGYAVPTRQRAPVPMNRPFSLFAPTVTQSRQVASQAAPVQQQSTRAQQAQNDLRESGMLDQFGMIR